MIGAALLACPASYVASFPESDPTARPHEQEKHGTLELTASLVDRKDFEQAGRLVRPARRSRSSSAG